MLDAALTFLVSEANAFLFARTGSTGGRAVAGRFVDDTGKYLIPEGQLGAALINVDEERTLKAQVPEPTFVNGRHVVLQPPLKLNLHVLFAANIKAYDLALQQLGWVLTFFQSHPGFTRDAYPALPERIEKLVVELESLTYEQLNQVWGAIGAKHLPSVMYRVRLVALQDIEPAAVQQPVTDIVSVLHRT